MSRRRKTSTEDGRRFGSRLTIWRASWTRWLVKAADDAAPVADPSLGDAKAMQEAEDARYSELHPRFKLIIDTSEDDSAARLLQTVGLTFTKVFRMSDFPGDNTELHHARLISDIKMSMERGDSILLIDTHRIHGSFCESTFTRIASFIISIIGSHSRAY